MKTIQNTKMRKMSQEICHTPTHNGLLVNNKENRAHKTQVLRNIQLAKAVPTSDPGQWHSDKARKQTQWAFRSNGLSRTELHEQPNSLTFKIQELT